MATPLEAVAVPLVTDTPPEVIVAVTVVLSPDWTTLPLSSMLTTGCTARGAPLASVVEDGVVITK